MQRIPFAILLALIVLPSASHATERVETTSGRTTLSYVATDALYGGVAGALIGSGIVLVQNGGFNTGSGYNWGRTLSFSTGIGILSGAVYGLVDAATSRDHVVSDRLTSLRDFSVSERSDLSHVRLYGTPPVRW